MTPETGAIVTGLGAIVAAGAVHFGLRRAARRLPRWLALRRGRAVGAEPVPVERPIAFGCFLARVAVWIAVARLLSSRFGALAGVQARLESTIGMSFATPLFALGMRAYSLADLVTLAALVAVVWIGVGVVARAVRTQVVRVTGADAGVQETVTILVRYALSVLGTIVLLQAWGIDVSSLTIVASVLGVGIGFGMQNIANNLVSGLLLALERPIKPGDFVQVGELAGTVERIGGRSTEIRTLDRVAILVPNSRLLEHEVVNWSHGDPISRIHVDVSVDYDSDLRRVRAALLEAARAEPGVLDDPRPSVEITALADSGIALTLLVWTRDPHRQNTLRSDLFFRIVETFARHGIAIPFPRQDVQVTAPAIDRVAAAFAARHFAPAELAAADRTPAATELPDLPPIVEERAPAAWTADEIAALADRMRGPGGVPIRDRRHLLTTYRRAFVGSEAVAWLRAEGFTRDEALALGRLLIEQRLAHHVLDEHGFEDGNLFYRFYADETEARAAG